MKLVLFLSSVLLVLGITASQPVGSVVTFGRCPNNCVTDFDAVLSLSRNCAARFSLGCVPTPCSDPRSLTCYNPSKEEPRELGAPIRPGADIVFDTLEVGIEFPVFVELSTDAPLDLDLYLLADSTGSMAATIGTVKERFNEIIDIFRDRPSFSSVHFGVGTYRDEDEAGFDNGFKNLQSINSKADKSKDAVGMLQALRGGDRDEANLVALHKVATDPSIRWRENVRRVIVYFGDVPGHEPSCGPFGTLTRNSVIEDLKREQITVIGISAPDARSGVESSRFNSAPLNSFGCRGAPTAGPTSADPGQTEAITTATAGSLSFSDSGAVIGAIVNAVNALTSTFSVDMSDCEGQLNAKYDPTLPLTLGPGEEKMVKQTVSVDQQLCEALKTSFTCEIRYIQSGVFLEPTKVRVNNIVGCPDLS